MIDCLTTKESERSFSVSLKELNVVLELVSSVCFRYGSAPWSSEDVNGVKNRTLYEILMNNRKKKLKEKKNSKKFPLLTNERIYSSEKFKRLLEKWTFGQLILIEF